LNKKSTIIKFPGNRFKSTAPAHDPDKVWDDFEERETHYELREKEDWPGLVKYCKQRAERFPDDLYAQYYLGDAYVLNGEYDKALEFLSKHHRRHPWNPDYHHVILDALYALGKTEDDFDWVQKPAVLRLSGEILDASYEFLRSKRKPRSVNNLYICFVTEGYLLFTEEELLKALLEDARFVVEEADAGLSATVRVARKTQSKKN
jgi:tetratricopeptide (TPR) repeat protein